MAGYKEPPAAAHGHSGLLLKPAPACVLTRAALTCVPNSNSESVCSDFAISKGLPRFIPHLTVVLTMPHKHRPYNSTQLPCSSCSKVFKSQSGLTQHIKSAHLNTQKLRFPLPVRTGATGSSSILHCSLGTGSPDCASHNEHDYENARGPGQREYHPTLTGAYFISSR